MTEHDTLLTVKEYAKLKNVCVETVRRWIRLKLIEAERTIEPKGHWRIRVSKKAA